jgi:Lactonase, 7-bladed beta-propeller
MKTVMRFPQLRHLHHLPWWQHVKAGFLIISMLLTMLLSMASTFASATPSISVISPQSGSTSGSPIFYEASATSSCKTGISAMRIYTAPGVNAFTVAGAHLETFIKLKPGIYHTVLQARDNCGGVAQAAVALNVSSAAGVSVFLPTKPGPFSPVHFAASAQNPACPAGIAAMRVYSAWGNNRYTVNSNQVDALIRLSAGTFSPTVQAWDNCGNVFKSSFQLHSGGGDADAYVYSNSASGVISQFGVLSNGHLVNPNGSGNPPQFQSAPGANTIAIDPSGWFVYTAAQNGIFGYQINPLTGALVPIHGSPFPLNNPSLVCADSTGNFLYVLYAGSKSIAVYRIDRSSGALTNTDASITPGPLLTALAGDINGLYLFAASNSGQIFAYQARTGVLSPAEGSPVSVSGTAFALSTTYQNLYIGVATGTIQEVDNFFINSGGELTFPSTGSPISSTGAGYNSQSVIADWLTRYVWIGNQSADNSQNYFWQFDINQANGMLGTANLIDTGTLNVDYLFEGHSAQFVYTVGGPCGPGTCLPGTVNSWTINGSGLLEHLSGPFDIGSTNPTGIAVERLNPQ